MHNLLKAEFFKLKRSFAYQFMLGAYLIFEFWYNMNGVSIGIHYTNTSYTGSEWFFFRMTLEVFYIELMWVFAAVFLAGDFTNRTYAAAIWCGYPRRKIFLAKLVAFFTAMLPVLLIHAIVGTVVWTMYYGWGIGGGTASVLFMMKPLIFYIFTFVVYASNYILFAMLAKSRLGALAMNVLLTWGIGCALGNALHLVKDPVMKGIVVFISRLMILFHVGEWYWDEQAATFPVMLVLLLLVRTILVIGAAAYIFCRHDMK